MKKIKALIIFGGVSTEHEVSRCSASSIIRETDHDIYDIAVMEISKSNEFHIYDFDISSLSFFCEEIKKTDNRLRKKKINLDNTTFSDNGIDVVFPVLHGLNGEDGTIQGFLEICNVPYVGCGVLSSAMCMDKSVTKIILNSVNIPQAGYKCFTCEDITMKMEEVIASAEKAFSYPVFVKPSSSGSSVGVSKAKNTDELKRALLKAAALDRKILIEEAIKGREIECAVLGDYEHATASGVGEVIASNEFYDYDAKYIDKKSKTVIPADISKKAQEKIREYAVSAFKALDCYGLARVDFFLKDDHMPVLNEVNTMPGFTEISMYPALMTKTGLSYKELITKLIELALLRKKKYDFMSDYEKIKR